MILPLSSPITLAHRVATVEAVVAELARKSGEDLRMRRELADEVLYVNLKPRSTGELMRLVAKTASAEWTREDGYTYLGRSPSFWRAQAKADAAATARAYAENLLPLLAPGDATPWTDGSRAVAQAGTFVDRNRIMTDDQIDPATRDARMRAVQPAGRFVSRILRALPPGEIAALPVGWRGRFAFTPTGA